MIDQGGPMNFAPLQGIIGDIGKQRAMQAEKQQAEEKRAAMVTEGQAVMQRGDPKETSLFMARYPEYGKNILAASGVESDMQKAQLAGDSKKMLQAQTDEQGDQIIIDRCKIVDARGGDCSQSRSLLGKGLEAQKKVASDGLMFTDPKAYTAWKESTGPDVAEYSNIKETASGGLMGLNKNTGKYESMLTPEKVRGKSPLVQIGGNSLTPGFMTDEVKSQNGIPLDKKIWIDGKGTPKILSSLSESDKKTAIALDQMQGASETLNDALIDYDPENITNIIADYTNLPEPAKLYMKDQNSKIVDSAKKTWAEMVLRDATGAVINESEYKDYDKMYMPQPFESEKLKEIKAKRRHKKENAYNRRIGMKETKYVSPYKDRKKKETQQPESQSQQPPEGYKLMTDANGNRAYVGPNGEIQEVQ